MVDDNEPKWADPTMRQLLSVGISVILVWTVLIGLAEEHFLPIVGLWFGCTAIYSFVSGMGIDFTPFLGYTLIPLGIILSAFTLGVQKASKLVGTSLIFFDVGLIVQGIFNLAGMYIEANFFGGWLVGIAGFIMTFAGLAFLVIGTASGKRLA